MIYAHNIEFGNAKITGAVAKTAVVYLISAFSNLPIISSVAAAENANFPVGVKLQNFAQSDDFGKPRNDAVLLDGIDFYDRLIEKTAVRFKSTDRDGYTGGHVLSTSLPMSISYLRDMLDSRLGSGSGGMNAQFFSLAIPNHAPTTSTSLRLIGADRSSISYFGIVKDASHIGFVKEFDGLKISAGVSTELSSISHQLSLFSAPYVRASAFNAERKIVAAEIEKNFDDGRAIVAVTIGVLNEAGSLAGCCSVSNSFLNTNPRTRFSSIVMSYAPSPKISFFGLASIGTTKPYDGNGALITDISSAKLAAWSLGLSARNFIKPGDKIGFVLAMPVKILSGSMGLSDGTALQEGINGQTSRINLRQNGTETDMELSYSTYIGKSSRLTAAAIYRMHPDHDAAAKPSIGIGARMIVQF
jgi:hypothetical protein